MEEGRKSSESIIRSTTLMCVIGALPALIVMVLWPGFLLGLFGAGFQDGSQLLRILAAGQFANAATGLVGTALVMTGHEKKFAIVTGGAAFLNIGANLVAIPLWGASGAASATALTTVIFNGTLFYMVQTIKVKETRPDAMATGA